MNAIASTGYQFTGFANALAGTTTPQNLTVTAAASVTANFQALPTTTIQSVPAGLTFTVDNVGCVSPCLMQWIPGTSHTIGAGTQVLGSNTQYVFASWSQGTGASQTITAPSANFTYTAAFTAQYAVSTSVGPSAAGNVTLTPAGGWYAAGTQVTVGAVVNPGWAFTGFTGGLSGAIAPQTLTVNAPVTLTANFTPDFSLAIPTTVTTPINGSVQFTVTVNGQSGFNDTVTFDAPLLPTGAIASFNPPTASAGGTSTVTITAPSTGGTYAFTIRGAASGGLTHGAAGNLAVQDFTVTALTPPQSAGVGDTVQYLFAIGALGGFNGNVSIAPVSLVNNDSPPWPFNPLPNCSLAASSQQYASGVMTLTFTTSSFANQCPAGDYHIDTLFNSGNIQHTVTVQLHIAYSGLITLSSPSAPQFSGTIATFPIHVTSKVSGQSVTFPSPLSAGCGTVLTSPLPLTTPGDTSFSLDTVGCTPTMYWVIVFAVPSGGAQQSLAIPLYVGGTAPPDFRIAPTPATQTVLPGATQMYTLNVASINGFSQVVSLSVSGLPSGVTTSFPAGSSVTGSGSVSLRVDTSASAVSGNFTVTATGGGLTRSATLTLNIVPPQSQTGFTLGTIPATTVPADGTVVAVPIQVTPLNGSSTPVTLRSISNLPVGMNVAVSGHTLMISAASTVPDGIYFLEYEGDDGNGGRCRGGGPVRVGGGGTNLTMYLQVPSDIAVLNDNQAHRIGPYYAYSTDGTPAQQQRYPASMVQNCSAGQGITVLQSWPSQSAPSDVNLFDLVYTVAGTTVPGDRIVSCVVSSQYRATPALFRPGVSVSCGTPTVSISPRPITLDDPNGKAPYYATLTAQGAPNGLYYTWSTNNSGMIEFDDPHASTVRLTIKRSGRATISVDAQNLCGNHSSDSFTFVVSDDITVISWIDGQPIQLPGDASATVTGWMTDPIQCHAATLTWVAAGALQSPIAPPYDVGAANDIRYINAFMYKNSADPPPPQSLTDSERDRIHSDKSKYRGFSRFQAYYEVDPAFNNALATTFGVLKHDADVGATPDFCLGGSLAQEGEAHIQNKHGGIRPDYAWWLNEFRVGTLGQDANAYLNKRGQDPYTAMPWVWALIQLDKDGKVIPLIQGTQGTAQIFPTYWVYSFDVLTQTVSQLGIQSLIALDGTSSYHE